MGFSHCESYWGAVARAVSRKAKAEHVRLKRMPRGYSWAMAAHEGKYGETERQEWIDSCHKIRGFKIYLQGAVTWDIPFKCPCANPRSNPQLYETYKGFPIFVRKTWRGSRYHRHEYFRITVEGAGCSYALVEGSPLEDLLRWLREKIDKRELKDTWGNTMEPAHTDIQ